MISCCDTHYPWCWNAGRVPISSCLCHFYIIFTFILPSSIRRLWRFTSISSTSAFLRTALAHSSISQRFSVSPFPSPTRCKLASETDMAQEASKQLLADAKKSVVRILYMSIDAEYCQVSPSQRLLGPGHHLRRTYLPRT